MNDLKKQCDEIRERNNPYLLTLSKFALVALSNYKGDAALAATALGGFAGGLKATKVITDNEAKEVGDLGLKIGFAVINKEVTPNECYSWLYEETPKEDFNDIMKDVDLD